MLGNKPQPAVVVQDDKLISPVTILAIPFTSGLETASIIRPIFEPDDANGLDGSSCLMTDKLLPVRRDMIGAVVGMLSARDLERVEFAIHIVLGMARA